MGPSHVLPSHASLLAWLLLGCITSPLDRICRCVVKRKQMNLRKWKWRTTFLARLCAAVSGWWSIVLLYGSFVLPSHVFLWFSIDLSSKFLIIFSIGVYTVECLHMVLSSGPRLLFYHHILIIAWFTGALITDFGLGLIHFFLITEIHILFNKTKMFALITRKNERVEYVKTMVHLHVTRHGGG